MTNDEMIMNAEATVKAFDRKQLKTESIKETFCKVDQDLWEN